MGKQRLNKAIEHARITVREDVSDHFQLRCFEQKTYFSSQKENDYKYTIQIGDLNTEDMIAFMHWFKEVKPDWLGGLEQSYNDGWNRL